MTQTKERKRFKDLNLLDRFLFAEAMEDQQNMELLLDIILNQETHLKQWEKGRVWQIQGHVEADKKHLLR